ncbi:MAG: hypothetical protein ACREHG_06930 [Candidatus Saccharimonadales bacterium]
MIGWAIMARTRANIVGRKVFPGVVGICDDGVISATSREFCSQYPSQYPASIEWYRLFDECEYLLAAHRALKAR